MKSGDCVEKICSNVPVAGVFDVIVCGGGPAGCAAALRSAREGARTLLVEKQQSLGGVWTAGLMPWILDHRNKVGLLTEIKEKLSERGGFFPRPSTFTAPPEEIRFLLEELCCESGVVLRYDTIVSGALTKKGRLQTLLTESPSGTEAWQAEVFIDATGNGDLAARAGCRFEYGNELNLAQPASLNALISGLPQEAVENLLVTSPDGKEKFRETLIRAGVTPSYGKPSLFHFGCGIFGLMSHHAYGCCGFDADSLTQAIIAGRRELHQQIAALRKLPGWQDLVLLGTAAQLGIREGRRVAGRERLSVAALASEAPASKSVCISQFPIDIHALDPAKGDSYSNGGYRNQSHGFGIPQGALISADLDNLLMAGRCISGDAVMHASYRVTGNAVPMGEAAGAMAAGAVSKKCFPREISDLPCFSKI